MFPRVRNSSKESYLNSRKSGKFTMQHFMKVEKIRLVNTDEGGNGYSFLA